MLLLSAARGCALQGITGMPVMVECDLARGLPSFDIVGLPDSTVRESRERVRAAIRNSGYEFPLSRITVNLAPADVRKVGLGLDLPIAVSILAASGQAPQGGLRGVTLVGELSLEGIIRPVRGILPACAGARKAGSEVIVVPAGNANEAMCISGVSVVAARSLGEVVKFLITGIPPQPPPAPEEAAEDVHSGPDFAQVLGQAAAVRALKIAVAGGHNLIMVGPPGAGKTLMASCVPSVLPEMNLEEAIEVTSIQSVAGLTYGRGLAAKRPFRNPHHSVTPAGMLGGGNPPFPGEVTLAHRGVLYLDEYCEYRQAVLQCLKGPMGDGFVVISRSRARVVFPSTFMLIASANPCPCGYLGDWERPCVCSGDQIMRYERKLSGPVIDRIDIQVDVPRVSRANLQGRKLYRSSAQIRASVSEARARQKRRYASPVATNAGMDSRNIEGVASLSPLASALLYEAVDKMALSARAYHKLIKVARTIADLDGSCHVKDEHVLEAIQYRVLDSASRARCSHG
jgi:magnesium chelatase family protein